MVVTGRYEDWGEKTVRLAREAAERDTTRRNILNVKRVREEISFSEEKMKKNSLFDSPHLFYDAYCLLPGQSQKVHAHDGSDKIYYVLQGIGSFTIGDEEEDLGEGHAVIASAGVTHGVRNETQENLVLLVTMAPKPT